MIGVEFLSTHLTQYSVSGIASRRAGAIGFSHSKQIIIFSRAGAVVGPSPDTFQIGSLNNADYVLVVLGIVYDGEKAGVV